MEAVKDLEMNFQKILLKLSNYKLSIIMNTCKDEKQIQDLNISQLNQQLKSIKDLTAVVKSQIQDFSAEASNNKSFKRNSNNINNNNIDDLENNNNNNNNNFYEVNDSSEEDPECLLFNDLIIPRKAVNVQNSRIPFPKI